MAARHNAGWYVGAACFWLIGAWLVWTGLSSIIPQIFASDVPAERTVPEGSCGEQFAALRERLLHHAAAVPPERKIITGGLVVVAPLHRKQLRPAVGIGKDTVAVNPLRSLVLSLSQRPLLTARREDTLVTHTAEVKVAWAAVGCPALREAADLEEYIYFFFF